MVGKHNWYNFMSLNLLFLKVQRVAQLTRKTLYHLTMHVTTFLVNSVQTRLLFRSVEKYWITVRTFTVKQNFSCSGTQIYFKTYNCTMPVFFSKYTWKYKTNAQSVVVAVKCSSAKLQVYNTRLTCTVDVNQITPSTVVLHILCT